MQTACRYQMTNTFTFNVPGFSQNEFETDKHPSNWYFPSAMFFTLVFANTKGH